MGLAFGGVTIDSRLDWDTANLPLGFASTVESARSLLSTIAGATITFAGDPIFRRTTAVTRRRPTAKSGNWAKHDGAHATGFVPELHDCGPSTAIALHQSVAALNAVARLDAGVAAASAPIAVAHVKFDGTDARYECGACVRGPTADFAEHLAHTDNGSDSRSRRDRSVDEQRPQFRFPPNISGSSAEGFAGRTLVGA
ncbi:MAG: hypothetical protein ABIQ73_26585 [Acidimicrobiales bacterium]